MTHKIISINRLRIAVTFLQGTFHPKHSTAICFEVSLFDISVELSPFAVKSMFWLSSEPIRLQEITYPDLVVARTVYTSTNHVNFISFDNDDMKPSKRQFTFLSLISGLNHNINKQNLAKFGFALSLQNPLRGHSTGEDASGPSLILLNYL